MTAISGIIVVIASLVFFVGEEIEHNKKIREMEADGWERA